MGYVCHAQQFSLMWRLRDFADFVAMRWLNPENGKLSRYPRYLKNKLAEHQSKSDFFLVLCLCRGNTHQATKIFVCQLCLSIIYPYHQKGHAIFSLVTNNTWLWISSKNSSRVGQVYKGLNPDGGSVPDHPVILTKER